MVVVVAPDGQLPAGVSQAVEQLETRNNRGISGDVGDVEAAGRTKGIVWADFHDAPAVISPVSLVCRRNQPLHSRLSWKINLLKLDTSKNSWRLTA